MKESDVKIKLGNRYYPSKTVKIYSTIFLFFGIAIILIGLLIMPIGIIFVIFGFLFLIIGIAYRKAIKNSAKHENLDVLDDRLERILAPQKTEELTHQTPSNNTKNVISSKTVLRSKFGSTQTLCGSTISIGYKQIGKSFTKENINNFVVIDIETTGLADYSKIIELAAVKYENFKPVDSFKSFINPCIRIPKEITKLTGITDSDVKNAPLFEDVSNKYSDFISNSVVVGHYLNFDLNFLAKRGLHLACCRTGVYDTYRIARQNITGPENNKLDTLCQYFNISRDIKHRAEADCLATGELFIKLLETINEKSVEVISENSTDALSGNKAQSYSTGEIEFLNIIIKILQDGNRDTSLLKIVHTGIYTDISCFFTFLRIKLNGNKRYALIEMPLDELRLKYPKLLFEPASKNEGKYARLIFSSPNDLKYFEQYFLMQYDKLSESLKYFFRDNKNAQRHVDNYLIRN
jgi:DNA polymerase III epsilon subunit family exonuclease